jgi:hypothetical protein
MTDLEGDGYKSPDVYYSSLHMLYVIAKNYSVDFQHARSLDGAPCFVRPVPVCTSLHNA